MQDIFGPSILGGYAFALMSRFSGVSHLNFAGALNYQLVSIGSTGPQCANVKKMEETYRLASIIFDAGSPRAVARADVPHRAGVWQQLQRTDGQWHAGACIKCVPFALRIFGRGGSSNSNIRSGRSGYVQWLLVWTLGRDVSMSPLEVAKAFNAPLLAAEHSNAEVEELVKSVGARRVRYQQVLSNAEAVGGGKTEVHVVVTDNDWTQTHLEFIDVQAV